MIYFDFLTSQKLDPMLCLDILHRQRFRKDGICRAKEEKIGLLISFAAINVEHGNLSSSLLDDPCQLSGRMNLQQSSVSNLYT